MTPNCNALQKSMSWCEGKPSYPGIRKRVYFTAKSNIVKWPTLAKDELGRLTSAIYQGSFVLAAESNWKLIDVIVDKSGVTSEAQGEKPSQTQLNKATFVHPGVGEEATAAVAGLNNSDNVYLVQDAPGKWRVLGNESYETKTTVGQDLGQGSTGSTGTTVTVEVTDFVPAPFYEGEIVTEDGTINENAGE